MRDVTRQHQSGAGWVTRDRGTNKTPCSHSPPTTLPSQQTTLAPPPPSERARERESEGCMTHMVFRWASPCTVTMWVCTRYTRMRWFKIHTHPSLLRGEIYSRAQTGPKLRPLEARRERPTCSCLPPPPSRTQIWRRHVTGFKPRLLKPTGDILHRR